MQHSVLSQSGVACGSNTSYSYVPSLSRCVAGHSLLCQTHEWSAVIARLTGPGLNYDLALPAHIEWYLSICDESKCKCV